MPNTHTVTRNMLSSSHPTLALAHWPTDCRKMSYQVCYNQKPKLRSLADSRNIFKNSNQFLLSLPSWLKSRLIDFSIRTSHLKTNVSLKSSLELDQALHFLIMMMTQEIRESTIIQLTYIFNGFYASVRRRVHFGPWPSACRSSNHQVQSTESTQRLRVCSTGVHLSDLE